ncbi:MAG: hypothetical protein LPL00_11675 [Alphaproteobacteria bacterium]|nr:hypothetical protein [Alphaproteobacteria bacterium]MDX5370402.1 hypothetical protein [Alphaproteobacteria bacterium]MDX5464907.1 hypothetical protein [Alphaproteobacteria bacterium]
MSQSQSDTPWGWLVVVLGLFAGAVAVDAIVAVWGESRPIGSFFEEFVARVLYFGSLFGGVAIGYVVGVMVYAASSSKILGWVVGLILCVVVMLGVTMLTAELPGVDWRFERLEDRDKY